MKYLRWCLVAIVLAYTAWIAFPVVRAMVFPENTPTIAARSLDSSDYSGGFNGPMAPETTLPALDSIQGATAVDAITSHNTPVILLWGAVIVLYLLAAFLHANGNWRSAITYGVGFVADLILTYLTNGNKEGGLYEKLLEILSGWDPRYVLSLVALVLGFLIYVTRYRPQISLNFAELP